MTGNSLPTGSITRPTVGTIYTAGHTIGYAGIGTDSEDGTFPPSAFTWQVDFHHNDHFHPFVPPTSGSQTGSFVIPTTGETSPNVWYRIHLTVQDSGGLTHSSFRDILPRVSTVSLATVPSGLQIKLDGQPVTTPFSFVGVAGLMRNLEAVSPQNVNATTWTFVSWSDGGAAAHNIATPGTNTTLTATYTTAATTAPAGDFDGDRKSDITDLSSLDRRLVGPEVQFELHHVRQLWVGRPRRHPGPGRLRRRREERCCDLSPIHVRVVDPEVQHELHHLRRLRVGAHRRHSGPRRLRWGWHDRHCDLSPV